MKRPIHYGSRVKEQSIRNASDNILLNLDLYTDKWHHGMYVGQVQTGEYADATGQSSYISFYIFSKSKAINH